MSIASALLIRVCDANQHRSRNGATLLRSVIGRDGSSLTCERVLSELLTKVVLYSSFSKLARTHKKKKEIEWQKKERPILRQYQYFERSIPLRNTGSKTLLSQITAKSHCFTSHQGRQSVSSSRVGTPSIVFSTTPPPRKYSTGGTTKPPEKNFVSGRMCTV